MSSFLLGVLVGVILSLIAVIVGKKFEKVLNDPTYVANPVNTTTNLPQATIIKTKDDIEEFLKQ